MPHANEERSQMLNSFAGSLQPMMQMPMFAFFTEMNGALLESLAMVQKDWAEFMHRRIKEDVAVSRQLMQCHSLADMQQVYSQFFTKAVEQYKEQTDRVVQRGQAVAEHLAQTAEHGKEAARARH
jgi:cation transport regulator ChaB